MRPNLELALLAGEYAVARLDPAAPTPAWAAGEFASVTRTEAELSVVCPADAVPPDVRTEGGWCMMRVKYRSGAQRQSAPGR